MRRKIFIKILILLLTAGLFASAVSATFLINSEDWKDVYSSSYYTFSQNETPYFVRGDNLGVFNVLPYGEEVNVIESSEDPMISNIENQVRSQEYDVGNVRTLEDANFDLRPEDNQNIIIVPEDFPEASLVAAPYARVTDSWVLIANEDNVDQIEGIADSSSNAVMIGDFNRVLSNALKDDVDDSITARSKFNLSVKVAEAYMEEKDSSRVRVASGDYLSRGMIEGEMPLLLSGTNYLPNSLENFLFQDPDHNLSTAIMVGNEMTSVGEEIRDNNVTRSGEPTDERINVFVKYGQARADSQSIYAISLFPLPTGDVSLSIQSTTYNPETGNVLISYQNDGKSRMYQLTSFEVISDGDVIAQGGDDEAVFIGGDTNRTVTYDTDLQNLSGREAYVEFSTTYGSSPFQLDTYLTEQGQFSPPLRRNLSVAEIDDNSNMTIESVEYVQGLERFKIDITNNGDEAGYAQVRLSDVEVRGELQSFATERKEIPPEETKSLYAVADLDEVDLEQNSEVNTVLSYGESSSTLVNSQRVQTDLEVVQRTVTPVMVGAAAAIILVLAGIVLAYRRLDIQIEVNS